MTVIGFYGAAFLLNLLIFFNFICRKEFQSGLNFFISLALLLRSYGQLMVALSKSVEMAIFANEIFYFGSAFLPAFLFLSTARLGKVKLPRVIEVASLVYSGVIMLLAITIGKVGIYYADVTLIRHPEGYSTLGKVYGPLHILYPVMLGCYVVGFIWLFARSFKNRNIVSKRVITGASHLALTVIALYALDKVVDTSISLTSVAYVIATVVCIRIMGDAEMHDLTGCILEAMSGNEEEGVIVFDNGEKFINANDKAKEIYPEIRHLTVGKLVDKSAGKFYDQVVTKVRAMNVGIYNPENSEIVEVGDRKYEIGMNGITIRKGESRVGTFVELEDVTTREKIAEMEARYGKELEEDVRKKELEITDMQNRLVLGLASLVESRDSSTGGHIVRTQQGVRIFSEQLKNVPAIGLSDDFLNNVVLATPMHDLGKIAIDDDILKAKERTPEREDAIIKLHTEEGPKIVRKVLAGIGETDKGSRFVEIAVNIASYHHEHWDGSGAPYGLRGKEIPTEARIVAFVDKLDYYLDEEHREETPSFDAAFERIVNGIGTEFDPELGAEFVKCRKQLREIYMGLGN